MSKAKEQLTRKCSPTEQDRAAERRKSGHARAGATRSQNTRSRTIDELRATLRDAAVQVGVHARRNERDDFEVISAILRDIRGWLSLEPSTREELVKSVTGLQNHVYWKWPRVDGSKDPRKSDDPDMFVSVTPDGLRTLQQAVAERMALGLVKALEPSAESEGVIDFGTACAAARARKNGEAAPDEPSPKLPRESGRAELVSLIARETARIARETALEVVREEFAACRLPLVGSRPSNVGQSEQEEN